MVKMRVLNTTITEISEDPNLSFEIEMDLDPQPAPFICPTTLDRGTPAGFYGPLGGLPAYGTPDPLANDLGGNVHYWAGGLTAPYAPNPNHSTNAWHFPVFNVVDAGAPTGLTDTCWTNASNAVRCVVIGPGTMTIHMRDGPQGSSTYDARLWAKPQPSLLNPLGSPFLIEERLNLPSESTPVFIIPPSVVDPSVVDPSDGEPVCHFYVDIVDFSAATTARRVAFGGFGWVPTLV